MEYNERRPQTRSEMDAQSPVSVDSRRKRRRYTKSDEPMARRTSETATSAAGELGSMRRGQSKGSSSFVGSGSGIYFVHTVQAAFARNQSRHGSEALNQDLVPGEDDRMHARNTTGCLWTADEIDTENSCTEAGSVTFDELIHWSLPYFDNWHPPFPFLLGSTVLDLFERISHEGIKSLGPSELIIVRAIMSISIADRRQMSKQDDKAIPSALTFSTVDDAISSLTPLLIQPSTLNGIQALVAVQMLLISMLYLNAASRVGGLIIRIAFHLGLHRCPSKYEQFSSAEVDLRKRVFWTIYTLERYLSQSLGLPVDLRDDDIDVCYPDREVHPRATAKTHEGPNQAPDSRVLLLPSLLARHGKIRGLTLELRHIAVKSRNADPEEVAEIEAAIAQWWNEVQDLFEDDTSIDEHCRVPSLASSHKLLLIVQKQESIILLNRPVISSGQNSSAFAAAMQRCIGASKQIVSKVHRHLHAGQNHQEKEERIQTGPLFWPGFTWSIWMSGLILVYAASEGHYHLQIAQREAERCITILETLASRGSFWPGACATALRDLQHVLKDKIISEHSKPSETQKPSHLGSGMAANRPYLSRDPQVNQVQGSRAKETPSQTTSSISASGTSFQDTVSNSSQAIHQMHDSAQLPGDMIGQQNEVSSSSRAENIIGTIYPDYGLDGWQNFGVGQIPTAFADASFQGFNDIFQLMDVTYQMSEQMYDPDINNPLFPRLSQDQI